MIELASGMRYWYAPHPAWRPDENWPEGVLCAEGNEEGQAFFFIREHQTLVTGDMFSGTGGRFHVFISPDEPDPEAFVASLHALLILPIERVLIAHGEPVPSDGVARIREALESA